MTGNRFLLIARVGPQSLHPHWLASAAPRRFDVLLSSHDATVASVEGPGVLFEHRPGRKVEGHGALLAAHRDHITRYDYVAMFDDDLLIDADAIGRMFEIAAEHNLKIAQPALTADSHISYWALACHPGFRLRYVSFVEMMCPVFRCDALSQLEPLFRLGYESGIDLIWSQLIHDNARDFAVIDAVTVRHTQPVGARKALNGFTGDKRYEDDIEAILHRFGAPWLPCLTYGGVLTDGREVCGRRRMWPGALALASAIPLAIRRWQGLRYRARGLAAYWKHLLMAPTISRPIAWPDDL
jgi:hypothetical protein